MMDPIQVAARAICEADPLSPAPDASIIWGGKLAKAWEPRAAILRQAVDAGLFCYPPKAWLAPMEATEAMTAGMVESLYSQTDIDDDKHTGVLGIEAEVAWNAARDAYTKEQT